MNPQERNLQTTVEIELGDFLTGCPAAQKLTDIYLKREIGRTSPKDSESNENDIEFYHALERVHAKILSDASEVWNQTTRDNNFESLTAADANSSVMN